jgi:serine/threonine protein kinase
VVSVEEIVEGPDGPALVMEYLDSGSLAESMKGGPLTLEQVLQVGLGILSAIGAAHSVGIIHRDLKPQNVLLGRFGQVKVCDFGISALARDGAHTQTSASTLGYASPEELDGSVTVGPPADVYSFCVTMVHIITGSRPSFAQRSSGRVGFSDTFTTQFAGLASLLVQGMAIDADDRPTVGALVQAFTQVARSGSTPAPTATPADPDATVLRAPAATVGPAVVPPVVAPARVDTTSAGTNGSAPEDGDATVLRANTSAEAESEATIVRASPRQPEPETATDAIRKRSARTWILVAASIVVALGVGLGAVLATRGGDDPQAQSGEVDETTAPLRLSEPDSRGILSIRGAGDLSDQMSNRVAGTDGVTVADFLDQVELSTWFPDMEVRGGWEQIGLNYVYVSDEGIPSPPLIYATWRSPTVPADLSAIVAEVADQIEAHIVQSVPRTQMTRTEESSELTAESSMRISFPDNHPFRAATVRAVADGEVVFLSLSIEGSSRVQSEISQQLSPCSTIQPSDQLNPVLWSIEATGIVACLSTFDGTTKEAEEAIADHYGSSVLSSETFVEQSLTIEMTLDPKAVSADIAAPIEVEVSGPEAAAADSKEATIVWFRWQS